LPAKRQEDGTERNNSRVGAATVELCRHDDFARVPLSSQEAGRGRLAPQISGPAYSLRAIGNWRTSMNAILKLGAMTALGALLASPVMAQSIPEGGGWQGGQSSAQQQNGFRNPAQYRAFSDEGNWNRGQGYSGENYGQRFYGNEQGYPQTYGGPGYAQNWNGQGNVGNQYGQYNGGHNGGQNWSRNQARWGQFGQNNGNWNGNRGNYNQYGQDQNWNGNQGYANNQMGWSGQNQMGQGGNGPYTTRHGWGFGSEVGYSGQTGYSNHYVPRGHQGGMPYASQNGEFPQSGSMPSMEQGMNGQNWGNGAQGFANNGGNSLENYESGEGTGAGMQNYVQGSHSGNRVTDMTGNSE
jgi:hypothetical protein